MNNKEQINDRQNYNYKLLDIIAEYIYNYPELRFGQVLANVGVIQYDDEKQNHPVIDPFYEESKEMYNRIIEKIQ